MPYSLLRGVEQEEEEASGEGREGEVQIQEGPASLEHCVRQGCCPLPPCQDKKEHKHGKRLREGMGLGPSVSV